MVANLIDKVDSKVLDDWVDYLNSDCSNASEALFSQLVISILSAPLCSISCLELMETLAKALIVTATEEFLNEWKVNLSKLLVAFLIFLRKHLLFSRFIVGPKYRIKPIAVNMWRVFLNIDTRDCSQCSIYTEYTTYKQKEYELHPSLILFLSFLINLQIFPDDVRRLRSFMYF